MASSSIAVMGMGDQMKVMLVNEGPHDEEMAKKMNDIINSTGNIGHIIDTGPPLSEHPPTNDEEFASISQFSAAEGMVPPPGTIIFSPQDLMRSTRPPVRGRARGRGTASASASASGTIKQEPITANQITGSNQTLEVPVACEICHKVMMTGKTLVQHMAIHSDMKPFQCPHCPKSFARKVHLQGHLVIHGIEKQFECPVCHQRFSRQDCVKVHMRLHDKSKCVYCDVCHKAFLTVGALNIHLRIHRGEKPFKCHLCSKCFTQKNHLITHIKRHTKVTDEHFTKKLGPRMFKCEHCTRAFIRLSDYERHVQWNHGAVAEGSVIDKLPTVSNLLEGEMKQTGLAPQVFKAPRDAINSKPVNNKPRRGRKVMCTTSTQTDEAGGHVIIPRMYQSHQVSAGTQMSAPPTPRPGDDDMYENDIFDEGMDRNYSSDEDEDDPGEVRSPEDKKIFSVPGTSDMSSDPVQDAAFDAIVQGAHPKPVSETKDTVLEGSGSTNDPHAIFLQEVVSSMTKQGLDIRESEHENEESSQEEEERMEIIENEPNDNPPPEEPAGELATLNPEELEDQSQEGTVSQEDIVSQGMMDDDRFIGDLKPGFHYSPMNPGPLKRGRPRGDGKTRGRGRGRGSRSKKFAFGLTGAAELRFIRKSMMTCILNATEGRDSENTMENLMEHMEEGDAMETDESKEANGDDVETEGRGKRMAKKQHGKDFVCNMKNCETCLPSPKPNSKLQTKVKVKLKEKENDNLEGVPVVRKIIHVPDGQGNVIVPVAKPSMLSVHKSPKPMVKSSEKHWVNQDSQNQRLADSEQNYKQEIVTKVEKEESKMKVGNRVGTYPVDITANPINKKPETKQDFFVATSKADSIVSPPVELMSFCIPTYSCKLCGREFRFEGKLHRHIESVHQNKAIFSDDVKPGRGSTRYAMPRVTRIDEVMPPILPQPEVEAENPEIAALRSEWDDDDDDEEDDSIPGPSPSVTTAAPTIPTVTSYTHHQPITIVTRDITPMTTTVSGSLYSSGVRLNMNKLAGLLPQGKNNPPVSNEEVIQNTTPRVSSSVAPSHQPREPETIMADTLDMKCRRLLEKLFNHDLLLSCGLLEEHVSIVLGKVLQHYGVKMIEDYGQGQYEVLKYNLWRLIEWKVTMEQMEEFYTAGKSVEEMMDDIMNERVPLVSHHFVPHEQKAHPPPPPPQVSQAGQVTQVETMEVTDGQMVLQQVAGVLGGQLNLPEGVTQVVLAQDVSPDLLQGAHIVTIDPTTGQVISQVTADQVILTDAIGDELEQQVAALDGQVVVSQAHISDPIATQESLVMRQTPTISVHGSQGPMSHGQVVVHATPHQQAIKLETSSHASAQQHHPHHHQ